LWAVFGSFYPQGRLHLGPVVAHYQFVQGGLICCFCQAAAAPLAGQLLSSKVGQFSFVHHPQSHKISSESAMPPLWKVGLFPTPLSAFVPFPTSTCWEFSSLPHPILQGWFSVPTHPTVSDRLQFTVYLLQFCFGRGGECNLLTSCAGLCSPGAGGACVVCDIHLLGLQIYAGSFETGRNGRQFFSRQTLTGPGINLAGYR
jgi:hypothetical protein